MELKGLSERGRGIALVKACSDGRYTMIGAPATFVIHCSIEEGQPCVLNMMNISGRLSPGKDRLTTAEEFKEALQTLWERAKYCCY